MKEVILRCDICGDVIHPGIKTAKQFDVDGRAVDCCGVKCFTDFWAANYNNCDEMRVVFNLGKTERQFALLKKQA